MDRYSQLSKYAEPFASRGPSGAMITNQQATPADTRRAQVATDSGVALANILFSGLGAGILGRLIPAASRMVSGRVGALPITQHEETAPISIGDLAEVEEEEKNQKLGHEKVAIIGELRDRLASGIGNMIFNAQAAGGLPGNLAGADVSNWYSNPTVLAAGLPLALGSVGLGYWGTDKIVDWLRNNEVKGELDAAKKEYKDMLRTRLRAKHASVMEDLDYIADKLTSNEKTAAGLVPQWLKDLAGSMTGAYGAYALTSPLIAGYLAYKLTRSMGGDKATEEAFERRMRDQRARGYQRPLQFQVEE